MTPNDDWKLRFDQSPTSDSDAEENMERWKLMSEYGSKLAADKVELLAAIKDAQRALDLAILSTQTGSVREQLTANNINLLTLIQKHEAK